MRGRFLQATLALAVLAVLAGPAPPVSGSSPSETATVRVISSDQTGITLELAVPGVTVEPVVLGGQQYDVLTVPGCVPAADPGQPSLPRNAVLLGIPPGTDLHVAATALEVEALPGAYRIAPAPRWIAHLEEEQQPEPVYVRDKATYTAASSYPGELARIVYVGYVRSQRVASLEITPFQYRPANGELRLIRRLWVRLTFRYPYAAVQDAQRIEEEPTFETILSRTLLNYETSRAWRVALTHSQLSPSSNTGRREPGGGRGLASWTPPDPAWKVLVNHTGFYRLTYADLQAAGMSVATLDPRTLKLYNQGAEVAIHVAGQEDGRFDDGDALEFYGQALDTLYTDANVYWLTYGGAAGQRMATRDGTPTGAPVSSSFTAVNRVEENHVYWWYSAPGDDHWFWRSLTAISPTHSITQPLSAVFTGAIGLVTTDTLTCTVGIFLYGGIDDYTVEPDHHALIYVNDHRIADAWWDGRTSYSTAVEVPVTYLSDITNTFRVDLPADSGAKRDGIHVNGFTVEYAHPYRALDDELAFAQAATGTWEYRVTGFSTSDTLVLDVTHPARVVRIAGVPWDGYRVFLPLVARGYAGAVVTSAADDSSHIVRFQDTVTGTTEYLVLAESRVRTPLAIVPDVPSHLADPTNQADYIIIAHDDLYTSTLPLAAYWQAQGMAVQVVRVSDVYDEFNYGILDPTAIRDFLAHAYANWQAPQAAYVLLVGDGTVDYRRYLGFPPPQATIPPYLLPTPFLGETGSDNWYACVSGDDYLPDLHIGRLPAANTAEAALMVGKTLDYAQNPPPGTWNQNVLFVADDADSAGDFAAYSDVLVNGYLPSAYSPHRVYYQITHITQLEVTAAITGTVNDGALLVNYIGHGSANYWARERLLRCYGSRCDFDDLRNGGKLPFVVSMTCLDGYYIHPDPEFTSLSERWLRRNGGGAVAAFAATGLGTSPGHDVMNRRLFTAIFTDTLALGPAITESKLALGGSYRDLVETYHLFGDPALILHLP